jgi:hypothetical protein
LFEEERFILLLVADCAIHHGIFVVLCFVLFAYSSRRKQKKMDTKYNREAMYLGG